MNQDQEVVEGERNMVPLAASFTAIVKHLGFPETRVRTTARALQERDLIPTGGPRRSAMIDQHGVLTLVIGLAVDQPLHETAAAVAAMDRLTPEGAPSSDDMPAALRARLDSRAGHFLDAWASLVIEGDDDMRRLKFEFVSEPWQQFAIFWDGGTVERYRERGSIPGYWGADGYFKAVTINGAALADVLLELFGEKG